MNLDIRELTSSLSSYSSATNQAVNIMADAVRPIGYILLGLFFWFVVTNGQVQRRFANPKDLVRGLDEVLICFHHDFCLISDL